MLLFCKHFEIIKFRLNANGLQIPQSSMRAKFRSQLSCIIFYNIIICNYGITSVFYQSNFNQDKLFVYIVDAARILFVLQETKDFDG